MLRGLVANTIYSSVEAVNSTYFHREASSVNDVACTEYPILDVFAVDGKDSLSRNIHFVVGHFGFFMFNIINVCVILFFHGILLNRLWSNYLVRMGFFACLFQAAGCSCTIYRHAIDDEFGQWAHPSNVLSLIAYGFYNVVIMHVLLNRYRNDVLIKMGTVFWWVLALLSIFLTLTRFETDKFKYLSMFVGVSTLHQLIAYTFFWWEFGKGTIRCPENFPVSMNFVSGTMGFAVFCIVLTLFIATKKWIIFIFPATGLTYSVMVIVATMLGEIDFASPVYPP